MILNIAQIGFLLLFLGASGCNRRTAPLEEEQKKSNSPNPTSPSAPRATPSTAQPTTVRREPREEDISARGLRKRREDILSEIKSLTGSTRGDLSSQAWQTIKEKYWRPGFDEPIINGAPSPVADLIKLNSPKDSLILQLATGAFTKINDKNEQESLTAFHLLGMLTAAAGGRTLPNAIADRLDRSPTKGDLYLFEILSDAFVEVGEREELAPSEMKAWKDVAISLNPIYRLLALKTFPQVAVDSSQKLELYKCYLGEKDLGIVGEVVDLSVQTADPAAIEFLAGLKSTPNIAGNPEMRQKIERSIDWLKALPPKKANNQ